MLKKIIIWMNEKNEDLVRVRLGSREGARQPADHTVELAAPGSASEFSLPGDTLMRECLILCDSKESVKAARRIGAACVYCSLPPGALLEASLDMPDMDWVIQGTDGMDFEFLDRLYRRHYQIPWLIADTKRLRLREMSVKDLPQLYELYREPSIAKYVEPLFENYEEEVEFTKAYIEKMYGFYGFGLWNIEDKESGGIIGRAGLSSREGYQELELGYMLSKRYRGRGLALEACKAVMRYAKEELSCTALNAFMEEKNAASARLCERLNFVRHSQVKLMHRGRESLFVRYLFRETQDKL